MQKTQVFKWLQIWKWLLIPTIWAVITIPWTPTGSQSWTASVKAWKYVFQDDGLGNWIIWSKGKSGKMYMFQRKMVTLVVNLISLKNRIKRLVRKQQMKKLQTHVLNLFMIKAFNQTTRLMKLNNMVSLQLRAIRRRKKHKKLYFIVRSAHTNPRNKWR